MRIINFYILLRIESHWLFLFVGFLSLVIYSSILTVMSVVVDQSQYVILVYAHLVHTFFGTL